jgi:hypothetical protein
VQGQVVMILSLVNVGEARGGQSGLTGPARPGTPLLANVVLKSSRRQTQRALRSLLLPFTP